MENNSKKKVENQNLDIEILELDEATALPEGAASSGSSSCNSTSTCGSCSCCV